MVKFGRHLEYYAAQQVAQEQQLQQHQQQQHEALYVVPYNDIKCKCIPPYLSDKGEEKKDDHVETEVPYTSMDSGAQCNDDDALDIIPAPPLAKTKGKHRHKPPPEPLSPNDAYFITQRFKTDWRSCLAAASRDFERATKAFWGQIFAALERAAADNNNANNAANNMRAYGGGGGSAAVANGTSSGTGGGGPLIDPDEIRGALPDTALRLYLTHVTLHSANPEAGHHDIQLLYTQLKNIHSTALINSEALRKLVKKFDKEMSKLGCNRIEGGIDGNGNVRLTPKLLPEVYSANFNVGLPTVEAGLALVRYHLGLDDEDDEDYDDDEHLSEVHAARIKFISMDGGASGGLAGMVGTSEHDEDGGPADDVAGFFGLTLKRRDNDAILVEKRKAELRWLRKLVASIQEADRQARAEGDGFDMDMISCLVGHRGFHSTKDKSDKRPLENSLMAYEAAWTNGIYLCECDIALTSDDKLILAHDENFARLALDLDDPLVHKNVRDLTYKEIMSLPLKSGNRPPLLFDVLRSAQVIGGDARMIVEIKPGNVEAGTALAKMFQRHPHLMERCAVVMSFDAYAMQNLKRELEICFPSVQEDLLPPKIPSPRSGIRVGSPENHELAGAGAGFAAGLPHVPAGQTTSHHGHRRGVSVSGSGIIPNIPTAMSIGDIHSLVPPHQPPHAAADAAAPAALGAKARSKSIDQLGLTLEGLDGLGGRQDSFRFSPFGQISGAKLIPPSAAAHPQPPQKPQKLETIASGVRVENAKPHPHGVPPHPLTAEAPVAAKGSPPSAVATAAATAAAAAAPAAAPAAPLPPHATTVVIPQLLLITRNGPAKTKEQEDALEVDITRPSDIARAQAWLHGNSPKDRLDGLYMQYQPYMLEEEGIKAMKTLTDKYSVGIWGANPKPDDYETFSRLVRDCGVSYINSGLPKKFMRNMRKSESFSNLMMSDRPPSAVEMMEQSSLTLPKPSKETVRLGLPW